MYNSIYPININYSNHNKYRKSDDTLSPEKKHIPGEQAQEQSQNTFPNGSKVAIDYTKGQINISQVLADFRSTILAINAPEDVSEEVGIYLNLVEKESQKENPSREIVLANLKNASRISDSYIARALNKPSNVVEKWIDTLFLQKINLKADPKEINPDFQLEFPKSAQDRIEAKKVQEIQGEQEPEVSQAQEEVQEPNLVKLSNQEEDNVLTVESEIEFSAPQEEQTPPAPASQEESQSSRPNGFESNCEADATAKTLFIKAKNTPDTNRGDIDAINFLNEALGVMEHDESANPNIKAAIHFERGRLFDNYDYVDYALRDYFEATRANDPNLKAQAFYRSGQIYDEFREFYPAMDNYLSSVAYSAEAENTGAQSRVLSKIASLYTKQFDSQKALEYGSLAIETAHETTDSKLIANTYSLDAQNSQYLGENDRALDSYKNALSVFSRDDESYEQMAYNYEQAAIVMRKLGNHAKAAKLQSKANQYYQRAQLQQGDEAKAS